MKHKSRLLPVTNPGGPGGGDDNGPGYSLSDIDPSLVGRIQISAQVQAPVAPDVLHKATVTDGRSLQKPLSRLIFSFKYNRNAPSGISDFEFDAESIGITYSLSQSASVTNVVNTSNEKYISFNFNIKQSLVWDNSPISFIYKCYVDYYPLSETAFITYSKI